MSSEGNGALLVLGATSAISQGYINLVAREFNRVVLVARSTDKLEQLVSHLRVIAEIEVTAITADLANCSAHNALLQQIESAATPYKEILVSYGDLSDQQQCAQDSEYAIQQFNVNGGSAVSLCAHLSRLLAKQQSGTLIAVSSVAGDRGRRSNYLYGAAKSALSTYLAGLAMDMADQNVRVLDVKPGFVDTPMTADLKKGALWSNPERVAQDIQRAVAKGKNVLYTPWFWRYIMLIIKTLPDMIMRRLPI